MTQIYTPKQDYKVLCLCKTFNQSKYIEDTLNGFAMQKTDFPFVCLVIDDCSTDGEQEVIKAWLENECDMTNAEYIDIELADIVLAPHKTNPTCTFAVYFLMRNLFKERALKDSLINPWREHCEYEALCEGDDYWIAPAKLQLQVNIMDSDKSVSLCYTRSISFVEDLQSVCLRDIKSTDFETFLLHDTTMTMTCMYKACLYMSYREEMSSYSQDWQMGDTPLWLYLAHHGKVKVIDKITAIYTAHAGSVSRSAGYTRHLAFNKSALDIRLFFIDYYGEGMHLKEYMYDKYFRSNMYDAASFGKSIDLVSYFFKLKHKEKEDYKFLLFSSIRGIIKMFTNNKTELK